MAPPAALSRETEAASPAEVAARRFARDPTTLSHGVRQVATIERTSPRPSLRSADRLL